MIQGKFTIIKTVYHSDGFNIYGADVEEMIEGNVQLNKYHNITIKTSMDLTEHHTYTLTLEEVQDNYGISYSILSTGFDFTNIEDITPELHLDLLRELTSDRLADNIHEAYPNFINLILEDRIDEIDVKKIYGVGDKLLAKFINKTKRNCITFMLMASYPNLKLTPKDCRALAAHYVEIEAIKKAINENPYDAILTHTEKGFYSLDAILKDKWSRDFNRVKWLVKTVIEQSTYEGSTYITTQELVNGVGAYDNSIIDMLVEVVEKADMIWYDKEKDIVQYRPHYEKELKIAEFIKTKIKEHNPLDWDWAEFKNIKDGVLTEEQQSALKMVCENTLSMLIGHAGTGKSSTVNAILQMLEAHDQSYILMAPTGKASQRLSDQTGRPAYTIHKVTLPILDGRQEKGLTQDWIIIDEMSMVSLDIMKMVIDATQDITHTRFLFIGDSGQIPSIGLGAILRDCIQSHKVPTTTLTHCFRFREGGASYVAECMRQGKPYLLDDCEDYLTLGANQDYTYIQWNGTREQIVDTYMNAINSGLRPQDICLLVPYNKGEYGTVVLNNEIQARLNPIKPNEKVLKSKVDNIPVVFHANDMVLVTKNNYNAIKWENYDDFSFDDIDDDMNGTVYNGQVGIITHLIDEGMVVEIEGEFFVFTKADLVNFKLGYALTVHKYQGSQAPYIINVTIPPHNRMLSRELCYTAQTRFSKKLIEIGDVGAINYALNVAAQDNRKTRLEEFLRDDKDN